MKWILKQCGVIPINRLKDDARAMRTVADTFEACFRVLESGEAIGIFPEGITYDDSQLKEIKSGAARMALELEHRHGGKLGLQIVPVGLTYSAKEAYRSDALVNFGEPLLPARYLEGYAEHRKDCIRRLTAEIEARLQSLIVHLSKLEQARLIEGIARLYLDRPRVGNGVVPEPAAPEADHLLIQQRIVEIVERVCREQPERAAAFIAKLAYYERWLGRLSIPDEYLARFPEPGRLASQTAAWAAVAVIGAPLAFYGWLHRLIPFALVNWATGHFTEPGKHKAQTSAVSIVAGIVVFSVFYGVCIVVFHKLFGWPASLWYGLSLPVISLFAHYYLGNLRRLLASLRNAVILFRAPLATRRLLGARAELIAQIEAVRAERERGPASVGLAL